MGDEKDQFMMEQKCRLKKLTKEINATKMEVEKLGVKNEEQKQDFL